MTYNLYEGVSKEGSSRLALVVSSILLALMVTFMTAIQSVSAATSTVEVAGNTSAGENQPGWLFNRDPDTATPYEFNSDEAKIGVGSLYVEPISATPADKFIAENFYLGTSDDFNSFAYDFQIAGSGGSTDAGKFYLNVYTNLPGQDVNNFYDCRFDFTPTSGSTGAFTTFSVNKSTVAGNVASRGGADCSSFTSLGDLTSGSSIRVFAINVGDTSASDTGLAGYLDKVVVDGAGDVTTYDFEPAVSITNKNDCKNGGWMTSNTPVFKNQGQCVSSVASNKNN